MARCSVVHDFQSALLTVAKRSTFSPGGERLQGLAEEPGEKVWQAWSTRSLCVLRDYTQEPITDVSPALSTDGLACPVCDGLQRHAVEEIPEQGVAQVVMAGQFESSPVKLPEWIPVLHDMAVVRALRDFPFECHAAACSAVSVRYIVARFTR